MGVRQLGLHLLAYKVSMCLQLAVAVEAETMQAAAAVVAQLLTES
jgi:hypothetical protein